MQIQHGDVWHFSSAAASFDLEEFQVPYWRHTLTSNKSNCHHLSSDTVCPGTVHYTTMLSYASTVMVELQRGSGRIRPAPCEPCRLCDASSKSEELWTWTKVAFKELLGTQSSCRSGSPNCLGRRSRNLLQKRGKTGP